MRKTVGLSHRAGKMKYILSGCSFPINQVTTVTFYERKTISSRGVILGLAFYSKSAVRWRTRWI